VTETQDSLRPSLSVLRREVSTSSGREAFIPILRPPIPIILKDNLSSLPLFLCDSLFHTLCKSFLRLRIFRELSLGENFSSATDFSSRALISGRGLSRMCATLLRDSRAHHHALRCFPTLVARPLVCRSGTSFRARGQSRVHWTHPYSAVPHGGPRPVAVIHTCIRKPPGPTAMPRHPTSTARYHLPSLPGSTGVSCASGRRSVIPTTLPSGSSPRLSATRATLSRAS
jgi:hypothetical protein